MYHRTTTYKVRNKQKPVRELELILAIKCANTPVRANALLKISGTERVNTATALDRVEHYVS